MEKQSTRFICIINYPGKHNDTVLLTYESRTKQLEQKQILDQTTTVTFSISKILADFWVINYSLHGNPKPSWSLGGYWLEWTTELIHFGCHTYCGYFYCGSLGNMTNWYNETTMVALKVTPCAN